MKVKSVRTAQTPPALIDSTFVPSQLLSCWSKETPTVLEMAPSPLGLSPCPSSQAWDGQAHADTAYLDPHPWAQEPRADSQELTVRGQQGLKQGAGTPAWGHPEVG